MLKEFDANPVMPPPNSAIFQLARWAFGSKPLVELLVLAAMMNGLVEFAPIVRLPEELMKSQSVPGVVPLQAMAGRHRHPACHKAGSMI
jgi:hypothetical protein